MKKRNIILIACIMTTALIGFSSVKAFTGEAFSLNFTAVGNYSEKVEILPKGDDILTANVYSKNDATLGLSLEKKNIFGNFKFISRCNMSIKDAYTVKCTWKDQAKGTYKGTVVLNTKADTVKSVDGYASLSTKE